MPVSPEQPNREQLRAHRQIFWDAWQKAQADLPLNALEVRITRVITMHPEYHHLFNDMDTFLDKDVQIDDGVNPYLHLSLHLALEEQLATKQPPEVAKVMEHYMLNLKRERHDTLHVLLEILAEIMHQAQRYGQEPDAMAYTNKLRTLLQN